MYLEEGGKVSSALSFNEFFCGLDLHNIILKNSLKSINKQKHCKSNDWSKLLVSNCQVHFLLKSLSKAPKFRRTPRDTPKAPQNHFISMEELSTLQLRQGYRVHELVKSSENAVNGTCTNSSWIINSSFPPRHVKWNQCL